MDYTALWAEIQANPACVPYITPSEPKVSSEIARANDQAIADILNVSRVRRVSRMITERGIREALPIKDASVFLDLAVVNGFDLKVDQSRAKAELVIANTDSMPYLGYRDSLLNVARGASVTLPYGIRPVASDLDPSAQYAGTLRSTDTATPSGEDHVTVYCPSEPGRVTAAVIASATIFAPSYRAALAMPSPAFPM